MYVEAVDGEEFNPNLSPADRIAIADLRDLLRAWGRYTFTADREKAELVFVVRKGRRVSAGTGGGMGGGMGNDDDQISRPNMQGPMKPIRPARDAKFKPAVSWRAATRTGNRRRR